MFDIGFSEVLLIFVLALIVLGPEKLPKVAAQVGRWIGRARGMARQFREQLEEEVNLEETRKAQSAANRTPTPTPEPTGAASQPTPHTASGSPTAGTPAPPSSTSAATGSPAAESDEAARPAPYTATGSPAAESHIGDSHAAGSPAYIPQPEPEPHVTYPDHYSHAHPTDSLGRPIAAPTNEPASVEPGQQDWVGGVTEPDKPPQATANAAYAPPHERGT